MVVPTRHHTRSRVGKKRSHQSLKELNLIKCPHCNAPILPHKVCPYCGYYKGKEVIDVYKGLSKKEAKKRKNELESLKEKENKEGKK